MSELYKLLYKIDINKHETKIDYKKLPETYFSVILDGITLAVNKVFILENTSISQESLPKPWNLFSQFYLNPASNDI